MPRYSFKQCHGCGTREVCRHVTGDARWTVTAHTPNWLQTSMGMPETVFICGNCDRRHQEAIEDASQTSAIEAISRHSETPRVMEEAQAIDRLIEETKPRPLGDATGVP